MPNKLSLSPEHPLCFIHIPKTGGTSLGRFLEDIYPDHKVSQGLFNPSEPSTKHSVEEGFSIFRKHYDFRYWENQTLRPRFITVLRHPVERIVSLYYFWRSHSDQYIDKEWPRFWIPRFCKQESFEKFVFSGNLQVVARLFNAQSRQLTDGACEWWHGSDVELITKTLKHLHTFLMVGVTDYLDHMMVALGCAPNKSIHYRVNTNSDLRGRFPDSYSKKPKELSRDVTERILKMNLVDLVVYEWAKERWQEGYYVPCQDFEHELSIAISRVDQLKQSLNIMTESTADYYFGKITEDRFTDSHDSPTKILQAGGVALFCSERDIVYKNNTLKGLLVSEIRERLGSPDLTALQERGIVIGILDNRSASPEKVSKHTDSKLELGSPIRELEWFNLSKKLSNLSETKFDPNLQEHIGAFETLSKNAKKSLSGFSYGNRDLGYIYRRYFMHPEKVYLSLLLSDTESKEPISIIFFRRANTKLFVIDYVGSLHQLGKTIDHLRRRIDQRSIYSVSMMLPEKVISCFSITAAANLSTPFQCIYYLDSSIEAEIADLDIYITPGDMPFV